MRSDVDVHIFNPAIVNFQGDLAIAYRVRQFRCEGPTRDFGKQPALEFGDQLCDAHGGALK